jgi:hypothetical protein
MKTSVLMIVIFFTASLFFTACVKDDIPARPLVTILELGDGDSHGNDHTAKVGGDLHIEVDIIAEGKIDKVSIRLHPEGVHELDSAHEEWEIDTTYTKFSGLKNTTFHEHLKIDISAKPGEYHFDFIVTDMEGNQSNAAADVLIEK